MKTPVDEYLEEQSKTAAARDKKDLELWEKWKKKPTKTNLQPLMQRFDRVFDHKVKAWKAPKVSEPAFRANLMKNALSAFDRYDPSRGASVRTYVIQRLARSQRFNTSQQNASYIPEKKTELIGPIDTATDKLRDRFGRTPTNSEIAKEIGVKPRLVGEVQRLRRADISSSVFESDPVPKANTRHDEVISLLRPSLRNDDEKAVFDYMYGMNGKPKVTSTNAIAKRLGKSPSQISRLKNRVKATYKSNI